MEFSKGVTWPSYVPGTMMNNQGNVLIIRPAQNNMKSVWAVPSHQNDWQAEGHHARFREEIYGMVGEMLEQWRM